jgi:hypothetical protein
MAGAAEKDAGKEKINHRTAGPSVTALLAAVLLAAPLLGAAVALATGDLAVLQQRFDAEHDGVRKAKLLQKLGDAQFAKEREAAKADDYVSVGLVMEKYRDNVRAAVDALEKQHPDAEKHSSGYRQLEIHLAAGLREVQDVILAMPEPYRPPMELVRKDLLAMDAELLKLLFPRRPGEQPSAPRSVSGAKPPDATEEQP